MKTIRVFITPCESGPDAWTHQAELLLRAFPHNDPTLALAETPEQADLIFITDLRDRNDNYASLRWHPLVHRFPQRCFSISDLDNPPRWVRGIHTSATRSPLNLRRFHTGSYFLYHPDFRNPFIESYAAGRACMPTDKQYLFSFLGRACTPLRRELLSMKFRRPDVRVVDTSSFNAFTHTVAGKTEAQKRYADTLCASKYAVCPRGNGAASIRLFEAMSVGVAPVILSDAWILPRGPNWRSFALFIRERDAASLEQVIEAHESEWMERGARARAAYRQFFTDEAYIRYLVGCAWDLRRRAVLPERLVHRCWPAAELAARARRRLGRLRQKLRVPWLEHRRMAFERRAAGRHA
ncbi:hypothetical protein DB347_13190 [Opitutaceae bacterium EW11]|nr:hypothetical protein DB347_13190 [Opitutaceae bacterium EW11]